MKYEKVLFNLGYERKHYLYMMFSFRLLGS